MLPFNPSIYSQSVADFLALDGGGERPMDLYPASCTNDSVRVRLLQADASALFPGARDPQAALAGLFLYFSCLTESHDLLHQFGSREGAYWHAIMHRMEGDAYNAAYWFHRLPSHPVYPLLAEQAASLGYRGPAAWDSFAFIRFCEESAAACNDDLAKRVQLAEWQLLMDYCAAPVAVRAAQQAQQSATKVAQ